jgi:lipopolysaccharide/colanic/teichoic acid biosynthesis glycosyltransferase
MKRIFDLIVSIFGLIFFSPFFLITSILIKADDKGPILFKQKRVGKYGRIFILYKFRTMKESDSLKEGNFEPGNISRITKVGKVLRRTKIDELPQLFNILKGDMSFVGPRPEVEKWVAVYPERWKRILSVKPGITDNSSIVFRDEENILSTSKDPERTYREVILPKKLDMYEYYVENNSFFNDLKLIFKTIYLNNTSYL